MIALHAIGMAIMVGLSLALDMRLLGKFHGIPYTALATLPRPRVARLRHQLRIGRCAVLGAGHE